MFKFLCSALAVLSTGLLLADNHPNPGGWGITGEYLYFMPTLDDTYFVTESTVSTTFPNGERKNNDFDFRSGYRVSGVYAFCDCERDVQLSYAHFETSKKKTITGDFLWATLGRADFTSAFENYAGFAKSKLNLTYERIEPVFAQKVYSCCDADLRILFGLEYAFLRLHEHYDYQNISTLGTIKQKSRTWGVGPQLGLAIDYEIFQTCDFLEGTLSLNVLSTGSILTGKTKVKEHNVLADNLLLNVSDQNTWRVIPVLHTRVGFNYATSFCDWNASLEAGYEFTSYFRGLARVVFPDDIADGLCTTNYYNFDMQGLYISASISF